MGKGNSRARTPQLMLHLRNFRLAGPSDEEVGDIVAAVAHSVVTDLVRHGYLSSDESEAEPSPPVALLDSEYAQSEQLMAAASASSVMHVAFGARAGGKVRRIGGGFGQCTLVTWISLFAKPTGEVGLAELCLAGQSFSRRRDGPSLL